jgi:hypothetical protein
LFFVASVQNVLKVLGRNVIDADAHFVEVHLSFAF